MGITGLVGSYETVYGGVPNRIHNVELVAHLINGKLIAPGATFSFNQATGARTAAKGFLEAPVIINGEVSDRARRRRLPGLDDGLQRRLRGRVCRSRPARTTRSTSRTTRSAATRPSTIPTST